MSIVPSDPVMLRQVHADYMDGSGHDFALGLLPEEERRAAALGGSVWRWSEP